MEFLNFNSVELLPNAKASAAFSADSGSVFREQGDIVPTIIDDRTAYMPWGGDNQMTFDILNLIESDETLSTCQIFNAEVCYGSTIQKRIIAKLQQVIVALLTENNAYATRHTPHRALPDIVQVMRSHPEEFQWHTSHVAKLFTPPVFENKKENKGFWF